MAVVNVYESWSRRRMEKQGGIWIATRCFSVLMESADDGLELALLHASVPKVGDLYPGTAIGVQLPASRVQISQSLGPTLHVVEVNYDSTFPLGSLPDDPLQEPPRIEYDGNVVQYEADTDFSTPPKFIRNAAGDAIRGLTTEVSNGIVRYSRNEATFSNPAASNYRSKVNSATFLGAAPRTVKCNKITASMAIKNAFVYWVVSYEFEHKLPDWDSRPLNLGRREIDLTSGQRVAIRCEGDSTIVSDPVMLDAGGHKLSKADALNGRVFYAPGVENLNNPFIMYQSADFNALNIVL